MAFDVNPVDIKKFPNRVSSDYLSEFLPDVDVHVDGVIAVRESIFASCTKLDILAVTTAPPGMGPALLNFLPGR